MCGITGGCWTKGAEPVGLETLRRMTSVLTHRGPDDWGCYHSDETGPDPTAASGAALGHRRLSIIDLQSGHQPLCNEDETVWIVFNGEIYNYRELRPGLEAQGHHFRTHSDTETIVHLYEQYGTGCVDYLRGMFAFAIWDTRNQRLLLARDRLGQKPLFYRLDGNRLLFASELKSLLQVPEAPREIELHALDAFLTYHYVPHPYCILKGYHKLPPAHWATFSNGRLGVQRYWFPPFERPFSGTNDRTSWSLADWKTALRQVLTESVRLRLRSDVPLGTFLSGGIDSTIVAGLMQEISETPVHTFSIGFPVASFDERSYAREAAGHLGTIHHERMVEAKALAILPRLIWHYDEVFADSSAIPCMYLSEMTRENVTVALSGDGGDELFAGYTRHRATRLAGMIDRLPRPLRALLTSRIWKSLPTSVDQKALSPQIRRFLEPLAQSPERRYARWVSHIDCPQRAELYSRGFCERLGDSDPAAFILQSYDQFPTGDFVTRTTAVDLMTYLPCDILTKVDIASMAYSLECRSPFLDHEVVETAAQIPIQYKIKWGQLKWILIDTFRDLLPPRIQKRSKMGFGVPVGHWFRNELRPLVQEILLDAHSLNRGFFEPAYVERVVREHIDSRHDHGYLLWGLVCLELWQRLFIDPPTPPDSPITRLW